jgi:hypothetical protein
VALRDGGGGRFPPLGTASRSSCSGARRRAPSVGPCGGGARWLVLGLGTHPTSGGRWSPPHHPPGVAAPSPSSVVDLRSWQLGQVKIEQIWRFSYQWAIVRHVTATSACRRGAVCDGSACWRGASLTLHGSPHGWGSSTFRVGGEFLLGVVSGRLMQVAASTVVDVRRMALSVPSSAEDWSLSQGDGGRGRRWWWNVVGAAGVEGLGGRRRWASVICSRSSTIVCGHCSG